MKSRSLVGALASAVLILGMTLTAAPAGAASATGALAIQLVTPAGAPLAKEGFDVSVRGKGIGTNVSIDSSGAFTLSSVPSGETITLTTYGGDIYAVTTKKVTVRASHTLSVKLPVAIGATVSGLVTHPASSTPIGHVDVALLTSSGSVAYSARTDNFGKYSIIGVHTGTYRVQFNSRKVDASGSVYTGLTWSYWRGLTKSTTANWSDAKSLSVSQQGARTAASAASGVNGSVLYGATLDAFVDYWASPNTASKHSVKFVAHNGKESFTSMINSSGQIGEAVGPGKYRVAVVGDIDPILGIAPLYWYVSDTAGPTTNESKATWVTVKFPGVTLHLRPANAIQ